MTRDMLITILSKSLIIGGLLVQIVGAWLVAYDALWGPGHKWWMKIRKNWLVEEDKLRDEQLSTWQKMLEKGARPGYIERLRNETEVKHKENYAKIENDIRKEEEKYPRRVMRLALRGLGFITLGYVLQIIGVILS